MSFGRQACPSCDRHWTPPGPCTHVVGLDGETCGYIEPVRHNGVDRPARRRPSTDRPPMPRSGAYAATGPTADPKPYLAEARQALAEARARKGVAA